MWSQVAAGSASGFRSRDLRTWFSVRGGSSHSQPRQASCSCISFDVADEFDIEQSGTTTGVYGTGVLGTAISARAAG